MKKRYIVLCGLLALTMAVTGCGKKNDTPDSSVVSGSSVAAESSSDMNLSQVQVPADYEAPTTLTDLTKDIDLDKVVKLGEYKGLKLTKKVKEVTDEDVDNAVADALEKTLVEVGRAAQEGDTVNIDYVGTMDGEQFDGGTASGYDLKLGSHSFIDGFEDGLIGAKAGDTVTLNLTFPKNYTEALSGKAVTFTVTVNKVQESSKAISEEWVKNNTDYTSVADYNREIRVQLENQNNSDAESTMESEAWQTVLENSVINEYPDALIQYGRYYYENYMNSYCSSNNITLEDYLTSNNLSVSDYNNMVQMYGQSMAGQILVMAAIEKAEGISADDAEYQQSLQDLISQSGVTEDQFFNYYDRFSVEQSLMLQRINKIIIDNATVTETTVAADETSETSETAETGSQTAETEVSTATEAGTPSSEVTSEIAPEASKSTETETSITKEVLQPLS